MTESTLITEEYRQMQQQLHRNPNYGEACTLYAPLVGDVIEAVGASELLDYGAGKGLLGTLLKQQLKRPLTIHHYDPAIPEWASTPQPCPVVACIDVLEHIEPTLLENVLDDLQRVTTGTGVFTVHTQAAIKFLPDGRNAHLIQQPAAWWLPKLMSRFELNTFNKIDRGFWILVEARRN